MMDFTHKIKSGQRVVVLGLGVSGRAAVKFLLAQGARVFVSDSRELNDLPAADQEYLQKNDIGFEGGRHSREFLLQGDCIVISPGIPTDLPLLLEMRDENIPILGELALAAPYLTECVVAVTGTNGKTTVTSLIGELLTASGKKVFVGGNIGTPILDYLRGGEKADVLVLELSSFQLESAGNFCPHIGVLLNITADHLDRHENMENYVAAKMKLFDHQGKNDKVILYGNDPIYPQIRSLLTEQEVYCFGNLESDCAAKGEEQEFSISIPGTEESYSLAGTRLDSHTGLLNSEAAILAVSLLGCQKQDIERGLKGFVPADHRLQYVRSRGGVEYYNDSKATNTGAVLSALESFPENIILLAGGRDKGEDYTVLKELAQEKVKELVLLGEAAQAIDMALADVCKSRRAGSMEEAVALASTIAQPGDVVLLAPACASFDMFNNYGHRGEVFMEAVMALPEVPAEKAA
ncbi:MAG: UDP-N-acetylmuramoyl-L-alanine--D-glutamate ligase [Thermodesulfobacteriota bacterium]|nr:UDP-N-acetylmuramoyl-L-alanine--D-glutamate ligase [Thermodesulfobacteriota bacterium]